MSEPENTVAARVGERSLADLQWPRIQERALSLCQSDVGRERLAGRPFLVSTTAVRDELTLVTELRGVLEREGAPLPLAGLHPVDDILRRARKEGVLDGEELYAAADALRAAWLTRSLLEGYASEAPGVARIAHRLPDLAYLRHRLLDTFNDDGSVRDDASPRLRELRSRIAGLHERLRKQVVAHLKDDEIEPVLQDDFYTMREERYVLPVKAQHKRAVDGIVHGSSNTGQTVYIEPGELIRTNNQLKVAEQEAEREAWIIRKECSGFLADEADAVRETVALGARLDDLCARALLAREMNGQAPELREQGPVVLRQARNPLLLLQDDKVVPNDIIFEDGFRVLVITGPNTGGKTVTLSTAGLLVLMTQAGFLPPIGPDSRVRPFAHIATSMGDAQDLKTGLSAFSGHAIRVSRILDEAGPDSLVLLDELMVGTEPSQGSALAVSFLEAFAERGAAVLVTTHYDRLKTLSYADGRFRNASVGLDPDELVPNFRLSTGLPGSSSPLAVARRLGLAASLLDRAEAIAGGESMNLDRIVRELEEERDALRNETRQIEASRKQLDEARKRHDEERRRLKVRADNIAREACADTLALAGDLRKELERMRKIIRRRETTKKDVDEIRHAVADIEEKAKAASPPDPAAPVPTERRPLSFDELTPGMDVWVVSFDKVGRIAEAPRNERQIPVTMGALRTAVKLADLREHVADAPAGGNRQERRREAARKAASTSTLGAPDYDNMTPPVKLPGNTADLRGMTKDDALVQLDNVLDATVHAGGQAVWVVHGHGTGVLKAAVRDHLRASTYVTHFRPGERSEGGDGVTLAWVE